MTLSGLSPKKTFSQALKSIVLVGKIKYNATAGTGERESLTINKALFVP
jgi:hypothetical protein